MKQILFVLAALLGFTTMGYAQSNYVATLQHEGEFIHYYGADALKSAYNAATEGDIITLSPGTFYAPETINKGITLRGTGIDAAARSFVSSSITFCSTDSMRVTTIEGVTFSNPIYVQNNSSGNGQGKIVFVKTRFNSTFEITKASTYSTVKGPEVRCYNIESNSRFYFNSYTYPDLLVYNSYITNPYSASDFGQTTSAFVNCVIYYNTYYSNMAYNLNFYNCILEQVEYSNCPFPNTVTCQNCLNYGFNMLSNLQYGGNNKFMNTSDTFSSEEGHKRYELTPEAQETYIGTDGTQIGLYGGAYPYNFKVQYPVITNFSSDVQTSKEGILHINVEVDGD